jgi:hypothetical protein
MEHVFELTLRSPPIPLLSKIGFVIGFLRANCKTYSSYHEPALPIILNMFITISLNLLILVHSFADTPQVSYSTGGYRTSCPYTIN